jgi:hypothetical protein
MAQKILKRMTVVAEPAGTQLDLVTDMDQNDIKPGSQILYVFDGGRIADI